MASSNPVERYERKLLLIRAARLALRVMAVSTLSMGGAYAHTGTGLPGGLESGVMHPCTGWDHLLAMVSVGIWGAFLGRPLVYALPVIFPLMMVGGGILGMCAVPIPSVELGIAVSVLVLGMCVCLAFEAQAWVACAIVATFAVFHGYAHGQELPSAADPIGYSLGFVMATGLLHVSGIGIGLINRLHNGIVVTRSLGAVVAFAGGWYLYRALGS
jgi:urease accessory protein